MVNDVIACCKEKPCLRYPILIGALLMVGFFCYVGVQQFQREEVSIEEYLTDDQYWIV